MATTSKRQAARNERQLQETLHTVPGNNVCADCGVQNPGWASWSLGIFLCVRCASLHRKLGVHVSKVKSLSMDSWSAEQVETMRRVGNERSNASFNPKKVRPDIPIDVDEQDGAMERFIRAKYEVRSLSGNVAVTRPAMREPSGSTRSVQSYGEEPEQQLPPKPKKFFSFRSSSAATPKQSKNDRYAPPLSPPRTTGRRSLTDYGPEPPRKDKPSQVFGMKITNRDNFEQKLAHLRDMGFDDNSRNSEVLRSSNGNLDITVETLVRLGEGSKPAPPPRTITPLSMGSSSGMGLSIEKNRKAENNPWEVKQEALPRSFSMPAPSPAPVERSQSAGPSSNSWNPFFTDNPASESPQDLQNSFQGLSVSQAGPSQLQQPSQPPLVPQIPQQYLTGQFIPQQPPPSNPWQAQQFAQQPFTSSSAAPPSLSQPFQPQPAAENNPFLPSQRSVSASAVNPWSAPAAAIPQQSGPNPWASQLQQQSNASFGGQQQSAFQQSIGFAPASMSSQQASFTAQPQQQTSQPYLPQQQTMQMTAQNPWHQQQPQQQQPATPQYPSQLPPQQQPQQQQYTQPPRHDKSSILALYDTPYVPQQQRQPLQTLQEDPAAATFTSAQGYATATPQQRSVTLPLPQLGYASGNPFMSASNGSAAGPPPVQYPQQIQQGGSRHVSQESVDFVGMGAAGRGGRHSPDAFAGLSGQFFR